MKTRVVIGDIVLVSLREYEKEKEGGDIIHKYYRSEAYTLKRYGEIPETGNIILSWYFRKLNYRVGLIVG